MRVLICGGGVIGAAIAYFLSRRGVRAIVIERSGLACAASGRSGGFLALDWCDGTPLEPLARRSFALHASLPEEIGGTWGYRRLTTYGGLADTRKTDHRHGNNLARRSQAPRFNRPTRRVAASRTLGQPFAREHLPESFHCRIPS